MNLAAAKEGLLADMGVQHGAALSFEGMREELASEAAELFASVPQAQVRMTPDGIQVAIENVITPDTSIAAQDIVDAGGIKGAMGQSATLSNLVNPVVASVSALGGAFASAASATGDVANLNEALDMADKKMDNPAVNLQLSTPDGM